MKKLYLLLAILVQVSVVFSQSHFVKGFIGDGYEQMNIVIVSGTIGAVQLDAGDEIAVFDGNLCVGVVLLEKTINPLDDTTFPSIKASTDDGTGGNNGFIPARKMYFRFWDSSAGTEFYNVVPTVTNNLDQSIPNEFVSAGSAFVRASTASTTKTWTGADEDAPTSWTVAGNWSPAGVPEPINDVIIPSGSPAISSTNMAYCGSLTFQNNPNLNIRSTVSGAGSLIVTSNVSGTANVTNRRFMTGNSWHLISSSLSGQTIASFLGANATIPTNVASRGMMEYSETSDNWSSFFTNATGGDFLMGKGFGVRTVADNYVTFSGSLSNGNVTHPVTKNNFGWNLLGNPFSSAMYVRQEVFGFLNVNDAIFDLSFKALYLWDQTANAGSGGYEVVNSDEGQANLASGQGFFIKAASGDNITFTKTMQVHEASAMFKSAKLPTPFIILNAKVGSISGSTKIKFNEEMTLGLDPSYDAGILRSGNGFDIYSRLVLDNGVDFMIQSLPGKSSDSYIIPIGVDATKGGEVVFSAESLNLPVGYDVIIEDKLTNSQTNIKNGGLYVANLADGAKGIGRFYLHVGASVQTGLQEIEKDDIVVYTIDQELYIKGNVSKDAQFMLYSVDGRLIKRFGATSQNLNQLSVAGYTPGIYLIKVQDVNKYKSVKFVVGK